MTDIYHASLACAFLLFSNIIPFHRANNQIGRFSKVGVACRVDEFPLALSRRGERGGFYAHPRNPAPSSPRLHNYNNMILTQDPRVGMPHIGFGLSRVFHLDLDRKLRAHGMTVLDGFWITLVCIEAATITCVLVRRVLQARRRKANRSRVLSVSGLPCYQ
ncbi:hypothetical protein F5Y18DRAFT_386855 [Xylariaceae sp. FL1019]|nr:hypothetical protein F5Y18DRAFT_386855 [Xylariaceae sp. FL1019]